MKKIKERETEIINSEARFLRAPTLKECLEKVTIKKVKKKYTGLHKLISNPKFLFIAYNNLKKNKKLEITDINSKILHDFNDEKFKILSKEINSGVYKPKPAKQIPVTNFTGGFCFISLPNIIDKIVQEAVNLILKHIYKSKFLPNHPSGFESDKGCHSALKYYKKNFQNITWLINTNIQQCFVNFDHSGLIKILSKDIDDKPFFDLIWKFLNVGYIFDNKFYKSQLKGVSQGSIIGPILNNIYLNQLDVYIKTLKNSFNTKKNLKYTPTTLCNNNINFFVPDDKKLVYLRYSHEFIIGINGSKKDAHKIFKNIKKFLIQTFKFDIINTSKILHFKTEKTMFLGVEIKGGSKTNLSTIKNLNNIDKFSKPLIIMPLEKIKKKFIEYNFIKKVNHFYKPTSCGRLIHHDLHRILSYYNSIYKNLANYYYICVNHSFLRNIHYFLKYSCALTIAIKMKLKTKSKVFKKYGNSLSITTKNETIRFVEWDYWKHFKLFNFIHKEPIIDILRKFTNYTPKIGLFDCCFSCGAVNNLEMHHVNKQSNIKNSLSYKKRIKIANTRKQIILCKNCHIKVHKGTYSGKKL